MEGVKDRLGDLSWLGIDDRCWIEVEVSNSILDQKTFIDDQVKNLLEQSFPMVAMDNTNMTKGQRAAWLEYRRLLEEVPLQATYPNEVFWPNKPE